MMIVERVEIVIRSEREDDRGEVQEVNLSAFDTRAEAELVNLLREKARPVISLVAEVDDSIAGHIFFSPVSLSGDPDLKIFGLAPMAVRPVSTVTNWNVHRSMPST